VTCPKCEIWVVIRPQNQLLLSNEKILASCAALGCGKEFGSNPARREFLMFPYHFSSAVTSIVRNCKRVEDSFVICAAHVDRIPHLILPISRQNALRIAAAETPNN